MVSYLRLILLFSLSFSVFAEDVSLANQIFKQKKDLVYQVRVIDIASGDRYSYGSGFIISQQGHVASNFHVVSSIVHEPEKYTLELVDSLGVKHHAELLNFDIIHDLSIIKIKPLKVQVFEFKKTGLSQGDRLYSMGNPLDLGMSIIEGTYNGLVKVSRYQKILFSGSLNSGMSGGPALDKNGDVIGINVSKGGEQISFLVPVKHLEKLYSQLLDNGKVSKFENVIESALFSDQMSFYEKLLAEPFKLEPLFQFNLPSQISDAFKCWGHTVDKEDIKYSSTHQHCRSTDQIFIDNDFYTGTFKLDFEWLKAEDLNRFQFYKLLETRFEQTTLSNAVSAKKISNFTCTSNIISLRKHRWKLASCYRNYKDYPTLYDVLNVMMLVDNNDYSLVMRLSNSGVSVTNAQHLFKKIAESIEWKE